jgi:hypothetical protein
MEFDKKYHITLPIYELKDSEKKDWDAVSENAALIELSKIFDRISPIIIEMLDGKEINTQRGTFRIKNFRELSRTYQYEQT